MKATRTIPLVRAACCVLACGLALTGCGGTKITKTDASGSDMPDAAGFPFDVMAPDTPTGGGGLVASGGAAGAGGGIGHDAPANLGGSGGARGAGASSTTGGSALGGAGGAAAVTE